MRRFLVLLIFLLAAGGSAWANDGNCVARLPSAFYEVQSPYSGECMNGLAEGRGNVSVEFHADGARVDGVIEAHFSRGIPEGEGSFTSSNGDLRFDGIFRDGRMWEGIIKSVEADGALSTGEVHQGVPHKSRSMNQARGAGEPSGYTGQTREVPNPLSNIASRFAQRLISDTPQLLAGAQQRRTEQKQAIDSERRRSEQQAMVERGQTERAAKHEQERREREVRQAALRESQEQHHAELQSQWDKERSAKQVENERSLDERRARSDAEHERRQQHHAEQQAQQHKEWEEKQAKLNAERVIKESEQAQQLQDRQAAMDRAGQERQARLEAQYANDAKERQARLDAEWQQKQELQKQKDAEAQKKREEAQAESDKKYEADRASQDAAWTKQGQERQAAIDQKAQEENAREDAKYKQQPSAEQKTTTPTSVAAPGPSTGTGSSPTQATISAKDAADIASIQQNGSIAEAGNYGRTPGGIVDLRTGQIVASAPQTQQQSAPSGQLSSAIPSAPQKSSPVSSSSVSQGAQTSVRTTSSGQQSSKPLTLNDVLSDSDKRWLSYLPSDQQRIVQNIPPDQIQNYKQTGKWKKIKQDITDAANDPNRADQASYDTYTKEAWLAEDIAKTGKAVDDAATIATIGIGGAGLVKAGAEKIIAKGATTLVEKEAGQAAGEAAVTRGVDTAATNVTNSASSVSMAIVPKGMAALGKWGEARLAQALGNAGYKPTRPFMTSMGARYVDRLLPDGVAHEAKAGVNVGLTSDIETQVLKDEELIKKGTINGAHWHFFQGAQPELLQFLTQHGIPYTVY